ncbi:MAG: hypothetical protein ACREB5_00270 [Sphingomonadaceae bacterium]
MPLSYGRTWDDMVALFRSHIELLLAIAGVFLFLPSLLTQLAVPDPQITGQGIEALQQYLAHYQTYMPTMFLLSIPTALGQASILALVLDPARPTVGMAIQRGVSLLISFIALNMLVNLSVMGGVLFFILPGIYLIGRTFAASPALVAEHRLNPLTGFRRGLEVTRGNGWRVFGILLIIILVGIILSAAITSVLGVAISLLASAETAIFASAFVSAVLDSFIALALVLLAAAIYRQLSAVQVSSNGM